MSSNDYISIIRNKEKKFEWVDILLNSVLAYLVLSFVSFWDWRLWAIAIIWVAHGLILYIKGIEFGKKLYQSSSIHENP